MSRLMMFRLRHPILHGITVGLVAGVIFGALQLLAGTRPLTVLVASAIFAAFMALVFATIARLTHVRLPEDATPETLAAARRLVRRGDPVEDVALASSVLWHVRAFRRSHFRPAVEALMCVLFLILAVATLAWGIHDGDATLIAASALGIAVFGLLCGVGLPQVARLRRRMAVAERQARELIAARG